MQEFFRNVFSDIGINDIVDILIVAFIVYKIIGFIQETRAAQLVKGLLLLVLATFLSDKLNLYTLNWMLSGVLTLGVLALVVVFQPELRRALEYFGRRKFTSSFGKVDKNKAKNVSTEITRAIDSFSNNKTGVLIVIEKQTALSDIAESGTVLDAAISAELLGNIFYEGSPLHDGAVIIRGTRIFAAGCVLPLTANKMISKELGTRHKTGIGITENSDSVAIIVSEETGIISIAKDGKLVRFLDVKTVEKTLLGIYFTNGEAQDKLAGISGFFKKKRREGDDNDA